MSRDWRLYLDDIGGACHKVLQYTQGMSQDAFVSDARTYDAVVRNLEVIGEAAKRIPDNLRKQMPAIDWRKIAGMRDVLAHAYFAIDNDILWDIVTTHIPPLEAAIREFRNNWGQ